MLGAPAGASVDDVLATDARSFVDVGPFDVFAADVGALAAAGVTRGCNPPDNDRFCPERLITRGEMAAFLVRALVLSPSVDRFIDTAESPFRADAAALAGGGITIGCNPPANDRFCPDEPVTRGQMAAFLRRGLRLPSTTGSGFVDITGSTFADDIAALADAGITRGCNPPAGDRFCPTRAVTRAEMAAFLVRGLDLPSAEPPADAQRVDVVRRSEWGAGPVQGRLRPHEVRFITIHHAASPPSPVGPTAFRGWQAYHQSLGWPDLAYHFIIGRNGLVYEGRDVRYAGDTATEYDPTDHFLVVLEGDFDVERPSDAQIEGLSRILAWAIERWDLDPHQLTGHRDHAATTCPGDHLYEMIDDGTLADRVQQILDSGPVVLF